MNTGQLHEPTTEEILAAAARAVGADPDTAFQRYNRNMVNKQPENVMARQIAAHMLRIRGRTLRVIQEACGFRSHSSAYDASKQPEWWAYFGDDRQLAARLAERLLAEATGCGDP